MKTFSIITKDHKILNHLFQKLILALLFFTPTLSMTALAGEINKTLQDIAVDGYDVTAYFSTGKPVLGIDTHTVVWKSAVWKFANKDAKKLFLTNPHRYAPQYGGHCANGLSLDHKVYGNPKFWRIIDNKLYLFFSDHGRERWANNSDKWIKDADNYWLLVKDD